MASCPILLGHRGHRLPQFHEAENSLVAFDRALAAGCHGLELDLHASADGRIVIHHDPDLRLCWNASVRRVPIATTTWASLRRLQPSLTTLDQVLRRYRRRAWLDLELKATAAVAPTAQLLRRWPPVAGFVVSSFELAALEAMAETHAGAPLCLNLRRPVRIHYLRRRLRGLPVGWIAPHQAACTAWYVRRLQKQGWRVLVWTVNQPARMRLLARAGVDVLVSDNPHLLVEILSPEQTGFAPPHPQ